MRSKIILGWTIGGIWAMTLTMIGCIDTERSPIGCVLGVLALFGVMSWLMNVAHRRGWFRAMLRTRFGRFLFEED